MFYKGKIDQINKVVVSDPSYKEGVWCRYESDAVDSNGPWRVQLAVNEVTDNVEGYEFKGIDFAVLLSSSLIFEKTCNLTKDGSSFSHPKPLEMKETEIGMDTACIALGINDIADEIKASIDEWQPDCALKTLTDGMFGNVYEGSHEGIVYLLYISGYIDEDAGYSVEDIVEYLSSAFKIKELELVKDEPELKDIITEAESLKESSGKGGSEKDNDAKNKMVSMPGTEDPDWGKKHWDTER